MIILKMKVSNYRILNNCTIQFRDSGNYLVGKNNVGKTSTLDLIRILLTGKNFYQSDFADINKPISVELTMKLSDDEIGIFNNNFSEENKNQIKLTFLQNDPDSQVEINVPLTDDFITRKQIQSSNFVEFSSSRKPINNSDITQQRGNYKLIPLLIKNYISSHHDVHEVNKTEYDEKIINFVNSEISKLKPFRDNNVSVDLNPNYLDYIIRSLSLAGTSGIDFSQLGFGIQFSSLIPLVLIDQIISWSRYGHLDDHLCTGEDGKKVLHIILCLDEPEVHLHPNLQLSVREDIEQLLKGNDDLFNQLLKSTFGIDKIFGQLIVVTHSPYILSNDYHEYIRFGVTNNTLNITSGSNLSLSSSEKKQLEMQLPYVKGALFADSIILVEGQTEEGAFPIFAKRLNISLVGENINIVDANGVKSIPHLQKLFQSLGINNMAIIDNDGQNRDYERSIVTKEKDFEMECIKEFNLISINHYLSDYETYVNGNKYNGNFWIEYLKDDFKESLIRIIKSDSNNDIIKFIDDYIEKLDSSEKMNIKNNLENKVVEKFLKNKSIINGQIIAKNMPSIPLSYQNILKEAEKNGGK